MDHLKIIVIGAGIGGLTAGISLTQAGYEVEVYEKTAQLGPVGAGISLWSNGVKVLNKLGLGTKIAAIGGVMNRIEYRSHLGELYNDIPLAPLIQAVGQRPYPVSRTDLQQVLGECFGWERIILNASGVAIEQNDTSATVIFADGRRVTGDLIIGADGARSRLRSFVLGREQPLHYAGYVNWNGLVPITTELGAADVWVMYVGEGKRASIMPIGGDRFYFFFGCPFPLGSQVPPGERQQELKRIFQGWCSPVQTLIEHLENVPINRLEIHDLDPLETMVRGRVVLVGDSAHVSTPTLGQGGCQALEDVEVLTKVLGKTDLRIEERLQEYEKIRRDRTAKLVLKARQRAHLIYGQDPIATQGWYEQLQREKPEDVTRAIVKIMAN